MLSAMFSRRHDEQAPGADGDAAAPGGVGASRGAIGDPAPSPVDLRRAIELGDEGYLHVNREGLIDDASVGAARILGGARRRLTGRTVLEAFVDRRIDALVLAALRGSSGSEEHVAPGPDTRTVSVRARPDGAGGAWLVVADVTELRRLQQIRSQFIENLSHELRTPLTTISLLAETLAREADQVLEGLPARMRDRITRIEIETGHLVQMVNELLDLARIEGGGPMEVDDDVDLGRLATASVERLRLFAERQGVQLTVDVATDVSVVRGNEARLGEVLANLLHNAIKFSPDGGEVAVRVRRADGGIAMEVEDHGIGIPRADRERIFERFYKVDRARSRGAGGTGLGLSITRHIVEAHDGSITLVSREGHGSTFTVLLPAAGAAPHPPPAAGDGP
jgi:two-component system phosphate regulon sensor histidine kinase PhoR